MGTVHTILSPQMWHPVQDSKLAWPSRQRQKQSGLGFNLLNHASIHSIPNRMYAADLKK